MTIKLCFVDLPSRDHSDAPAHIDLTGDDPNRHGFPACAYQHEPADGVLETVIDIHDLRNLPAGTRYLKVVYEL